MRTGITVEVTADDRQRLAAIVADRNSPQKHVWRANIVLLTADGCGTVEIMRRAGVSKTAVWRWQARFMTDPQRSPERTHFCSPELTQRVRIGLWPMGWNSRYSVRSEATIPLFDRRNHSSAPTWVPHDMASAGGQ